MTQRQQPFMTSRGMANKREEYRQLVAHSLKLPLDKLEHLTHLGRYPGVQAKVRCFAKDAYPLGKALRAIFDEVVQAIEAEAADIQDRELSRVATFLRVWYTQESSVAEAARQLQLTRAYVSSKIKPLAVKLLVRQIIHVMERFD